MEFAGCKYGSDPGTEVLGSVIFISFFTPLSAHIMRAGHMQLALPIFVLEQLLSG